jgi:ribosome-binding protein aMBF1 (putative translation factor)
MNPKSTAVRLSLRPEPTATDLATLKPRERKVLALRQTLSLQAISRELGVSKERVRQIQNRAIEKLSKRIPGLQAVIDRSRRRRRRQLGITTTTPITTAIVGQRLQLLLKTAGLTQQELADAVDTSQPTINDYLHGRVMPTLPILERIAAALGVRLRELVDPD